MSVWKLKRKREPSHILRQRPRQQCKERWYIVFREFLDADAVWNADINGTHKETQKLMSKDERWGPISQLITRMFNRGFWIDLPATKIQWHAIVNNIPANLQRVLEEQLLHLSRGWYLQRLMAANCQTIKPLKVLKWLSFGKLQYCFIAASIHHWSLHLYEMLKGNRLLITPGIWTMDVYVSLRTPSATWFLWSSGVQNAFRYEEWKKRNSEETKVDMWTICTKNCVRMLGYEQINGFASLSWWAAKIVDSSMANCTTR